MALGVNYVTTAEGEVAKCVQCEECGHAYGYVMRRYASGSAGSFFSLDFSGAAERSSREARARLARRLRRQCDPVPCPACGHYQRAMIPVRASAH